MEICMFFSGTLSIFLFFLSAFAVQQIQWRPTPMAGFSYGSLVTGIWGSFFFFIWRQRHIWIFCLPAAQDGFVADEAFQWLISLSFLHPVLSQTPSLLCNFSLLIMLISSGVQSQPRGAGQKHNYTCKGKFKREKSSQGRCCLQACFLFFLVEVCVHVSAHASHVHPSIQKQLLWHFDVCCMETTYCVLWSS